MTLQKLLNDIGKAVNDCPQILDCEITNVDTVCFIHPNETTVESVSFDVHNSSGHSYRFCSSWQTGKKGAFHD